MSLDLRNIWDFCCKSAEGPDKMAGFALWTESEKGGPLSRYQGFEWRCVIVDVRPSLRVTQLKTKQIKTKLFCLDMVTRSTCCHFSYKIPRMYFTNGKVINYVGVDLGSKIIQVHVLVHVVVLYCSRKPTLRPKQFLIKNYFAVTQFRIIYALIVITVNTTLTLIRYTCTF